ncbi:MAG: protein kinase domain-containing protein, partial [Pyrinomonadaceae bacterium]
MDAENLKQIEEIYHAVLEIESEKRDSFLKERCGADEDLLREVKSLLGFEKSSERFLDTPPESFAAAMLLEQQKNLVGEEIGHYKLKELVGAGGMGEVYLAEDTRLNRKVALKILHEDVTANTERLRRFEKEARAASALNHPNILTVHEFGTSENIHFLATEYVEGETLLEAINGCELTLIDALKIAEQTASALSAAHEAGIIHRDIKPDNIMLRHDGYVKVLDFGIAKLTENSDTFLTTDSESPTRQHFKTNPGAVIGTANYMSPEQARGKDVDVRADIFSLGVVLFEMMAGQKPFMGENSMDVIGAILHKEPTPINQLLPELPIEIQEIVNKTLRKDRDERYQSAKDLFTDLRRNRQRLEFESNLNPSSLASGKMKISEHFTNTGDVNLTHRVTAQPANSVHTTTNEELTVSWIKTRKFGFVLALIALVIAGAAFSYFLYFKSGHAAPLTDKDTILIADFDNRTGEAVFDGTLKQGLSVILGQSPFLDIFPESRVRETLASMEHNSDERVTDAIAREICLRQGLKAFISGAISSLGSNYVITLKAVNAQTGDEMASEQVEAGSKEQVLKTISQAAIQLRGKLGESLSSIQKFDAPIEQATTASLEALKAYSLGLEQTNIGNYTNALPFFQRAVELDPNFASGYLLLARNQFNTGRNNEAIISATKAYDLRERATENEKLYITLVYHRTVTNDLEKAIEVGEVWKQTYPHFWRTYHALADLYIDVGQYEKAVDNGREAIRLNPKVASVYSNPAGALMYLNRFAEARDIYQQALANDLDAPEYHMYLYWIAYFDGDTTA